jgi:hypothetical protein
MTVSIIENAFGHLDNLATSVGLFEHADHSIARPEHGYCVDDMARLLVVSSHALVPQSEVVSRLSALAFDFVREAQVEDGSTRNRRAVSGAWETESSTSDCWGRGLWGLGVTVSSHRDASYRKDALVCFERGAWRRSPWRRSMAFAAIGGAAVLEAEFANDVARELLSDSIGSLRSREERSKWPWPERRLAYANAVIPDAFLSVGAALLNDQMIMEGLNLLEWLVAHETLDGHLSVTSSAGAAPGDLAPQFDQQPIEIASLAEACVKAHRITGDGRWAERVFLCEAWFMGSNDLGVCMIDPESGGCYDGLCANGPNLNQGAESTLALISTALCSLAVRSS